MGNRVYNLRFSVDNDTTIAVLNVVKYSINSFILCISDIVYIDSFHGIQHTSKRTPPFNIVNASKIGLET